MEAIKTAYSTAYSRMLVLAKSGVIGHVTSVSSVCTSLRKDAGDNASSLFTWGPIAMLPVFQLLGTDYSRKSMISFLEKTETETDYCSKIEFLYHSAVASILVGNGVKSEGELIVSGTSGYIFVPAPWWKTDYFEVRRENPADNRRYFYQLDGEGIRYEIVTFVQAIKNGKANFGVERNISCAIAQIIEDFNNKNDLQSIVLPLEEQ